MELLARIRAALRHCAKRQDEPIYRSGSLTVNLALRRVTLAGATVSLTPIEVELGVYRSEKHL